MKDLAMLMMFMGTALMIYVLTEMCWDKVSRILRRKEIE